MAFPAFAASLRLLALFWGVSAIFFEWISQEWTHFFRVAQEMQVQYFILPSSMATS